MAGQWGGVGNKFVHNGGNFRRNAFRVFTNDDYLKLLTEKGMEVYTRPDGRIFPEPPADAKDVVAVMEAIVREAGVNIVLGAKIHGLLVTNNKAIGVEMDDGSRIGADAVIVAVEVSDCTSDWRDYIVFTKTRRHSCTACITNTTARYKVCNPVSYTNITLPKIIRG